MDGEGGDHREEGEDKGQWDHNKEKTEGKRWFSVTGECSVFSSQPLLILQAASTYVGLWAGVDHMERTVG